MTAPAERDGLMVLPERMDISAAKKLRDAVLAETGDLVLDARAVALVTTPALQVLMAVRDHQAANDRSVIIQAPSLGFTDAIRMLGTTLDRLQTGGVSA